MKTPKDGEQYFFVDESGDPYFYDRYGRSVLETGGCSNILILGFIRTDNPVEIRRQLQSLRTEISNDEYLAKIPSMKETLKTFHAKDDCPEVREKVFKLIKTLDFKCQMILARKIENIFVKSHKKNPNSFYDYLITLLFQNQLHEVKTNTIFFATKSNKARRIPLEKAINESIKAFEARCKIKVDTQIQIQPQTPFGEPCIQVIDYMNWALYRAYTKEESRYLEFVQDKISLITDIYDFAKYPKNYYSRKNVFSLDKITPLTDNKNEPPITSPR